MLTFSLISFQLPETSRKQSIFQRVQRLRSARQVLPSTTDSDSDVPTKSPPRRESPRIRKRESPKSRRKESPKLRKKESPSIRRKERESPATRRKESPKQRAIPEGLVSERDTDRREEYVSTSSSSVLAMSQQKHDKALTLSTVTLQTANINMVLPKDMCTDEINGVARKSKTPVVSTIYEQKEPESINIKIKTKPVQTTKGTEPKFPDLLIPEWKKQMDGRKMMTQQSCLEDDSDNEVFAPPETIREQMIIPIKAKSDECARLLVDRSFDSSETSEDTLKYISPEASPAPKQELVKSPLEFTIIKRSIKQSIETASDPGRSRPTSLIRVSVETHGTPLLLRKSPTGQLMRGQMGRVHTPVIPMKIIKPAQELLDDSQRYRSGQSIYLSRILKRYPMKIEYRSRGLEDQLREKESVKEGYVKAMVKQLSREGTPDSKGSPQMILKGIPSEPVQKTESPKSEFVSHIVQRMQTPNGPPVDSSTSPLRDLTNGGQVQMMKQAFNENSSNRDRTYSETLVLRSPGTPGYNSEDASSSASTVAFSPLGTGNGNPDTNIRSIATYSSMPMLTLEGEDVCRERSATASSSSRVPTHSPIDSPSQRHKIHAISMSPGRSRRVIDPTLSPALMRRSPGRRRRIHEPSPIEIVQEEPAESSADAQSQTLPSVVDIKTGLLCSPKSKRKEKSKMGTIEILCRQSMTFDLGISETSGVEGLGAQGEEQGSQALPIRHSTSSTTSASSQSEVEGAAGHSGEKKKSKHKKFMDSSFMQKSKRFFKVSK